MNELQAFIASKPMKTVPQNHRDAKRALAASMAERKAGRKARAERPESASKRASVATGSLAACSGAGFSSPEPTAKAGGPPAKAESHTRPNGAPVLPCALPTDHSGVTMSCPCGHTGDADAFLTDSFGLDRPRGEIQCPACGWAVHRRLSRDKKQIILEPITPTFDFTTPPPQPQPPTNGKTKYAKRTKNASSSASIATSGPCPF